MHAEDAFLDGGSQGEPVEAVVEAGPGHDASLVPQPLYALYPKAEQRIDVCCLHAARQLRPSNRDPVPLELITIVHHRACMMGLMMGWSGSVALSPA